MRVTGVIANLPVADIAAARDFYTHYLGLSVEDFNLGWVARYGSPDGNAFVQLVTGDATAPQDSVISAWVRDRSPAHRRGMGSAEVLCPCARRQCDQHGEPQRRVGSLIGGFDSTGNLCCAALAIGRDECVRLCTGGMTE
jgi:catechol 2,3-dioxygenase-like lactoylglutathione lyase family enzyme